MIQRILATTLVATLTLSAHASLAQSVAYVIGMSKYDPATNANSEAARVATQELERAGYRVFGGENLNRTGTFRALEEFEAAASDAERAVVFVAGKFASKGDANWLLLPGTRSRSAVAMSRDAVSLDGILSTLAGLGGRSAAFISTGRSARPTIDVQYGLREGLGRISQSDGQVIFTGQPDALARTLAAALEDRTTLASVGSRRDIRVQGFIAPTLELGRQRATIGNALAGGGSDGDRAAWEVANSADTKAGYEAYLKQFPGGDFAGIARSRLSEAAAPAANPDEVAEQDLRLSRANRRDVQKKLTLLGFDTRGVDGIFGRGSRDAISRFQRSAGYEPTGYLTRPMIRELDRRAAVRQAEIEEEERRAKREREDADIRFWRSTGASGRPDDLRAYLNRYPDGLYANEARREMDRLGLSGGDDDADWNRAFQADTVKAYQTYLNAHPRGKYRRDAQTRIKVLQASARKNPTRPADPAATEKALKLRQIDRASLELRLGTLGFNPGFPEGKFDKRTRKALSQFQERQNLAVTGYFDKPTIDRIMSLTRN